MARTRGGNKMSIVLQGIASAASNARKVRVGFLSGAIYPDGTQVALIAAIQDYGAPGANIPSRPFFRNMVRDKKGQWPVQFSKVLKANKYDAKFSLELMGQGIEDQLKEAINQFEGTPLKAATIARKGFAKQLIHSSYMVNHTGHEVK